MGHHLVEEFLKDHKVVCLLRPNTKNLARLESVLNRIKIIYHDIQEPAGHLLKELEGTDVVLHAAGNPSSEESTKNPVSAIKDNILGTTHILDLAKDLNLKRFVFYSGGEVYGPVPEGVESLETDHPNILTMYAGTKAAGENLCVAYHHTYNIPMSIVHVSNTFGPRSQSNRFPVIAMKKIINGESLIIHKGSDGSVSGRRWLPAQDVANHTKLILQNQKTGCEKWNSAGLQYFSNIDFAMMIADAMNVPFKFKLIESNRTGHAPRFSCSPSKLLEHGWKEPINIQQRIKDTVDWYMNNKHWLEK